VRTAVRTAALRLQSAEQPENLVTQILSGQFDDFERAELLATELQTLGVDSDDIQKFVLNAPGQHDRYPIGGDEDADPTARGGESGAATGAALGGAAGVALGAAAIPIVGPAAAVAGLAIGAYTGSLAGALNVMGKHADAQQEPTIRRPAGVRVVVQVPTQEQKALVLDALLRHHARSVEEAEGTWRNGAWADFDPVSVPRWVVPPQN
jgi:hypothetical protein